MGLQKLNISTTPDGGDGDHLRAGGEKINANFGELYSGKHVDDAPSAQIPSDTDLFGIRQVGALQKLTFGQLWEWLLQRLTAKLHPTVIVSGVVNITQAAHNNRMLILNPGASVLIDWNNLNNGFSCVLLNRTGANLTPTTLNFTPGEPVNADNATILRPAGMAAVLTFSPDGGTTRILRLSGELTD
jgi:hypothetical protein